MPEQYKICKSALKDIQMEIRKYGSQDENQETKMYFEEVRKLFPDISEEDVKKINFLP